MNNDNAVNQREKSLGEQILVILGFSVLMAIFIHYFFKNQQEINAAGFKNLANNFASQVTLIHSQWLMEGKPAVLKAKLNTQQTRRQASENTNIHWLIMNKQGWLQVKNEPLACEKIWQQVMATPMTFIKQPISAILLSHQHDATSEKQTSIEKNDDKNTLICRFSVKSGQYFEYFPKNGKVIHGK